MTFGIAASVALGMSGIAGAETITARFSGTLGQQINITSPTLNGNVNTVKFNWTRQDSPGAGVNSSIAQDYTAYCVDLAQAVNANSNHAYNVVSPSDHGFSLSQTTLLGRLWADYFPVIDTSDESAAFQMAIWEIIHDSAPNLSDGAFRVNTVAPASALATSWIGSVSAVGYVSTNPVQQLVVLESATVQDQITVVPAPATAALAGLGMLALGSRRRRN